MKMKFMVATALLGTGLVSGVFASAGITITAPQVTSWSNASPAQIQSINNELNTLCGQLETNLNSQVFSQLHSLNDLTRGFANSSTAVSDDASLLSFQTYDLFSVMIGTNIGVALPSLNPNQVVSSLSDVATNGDVYAGLATGGIAGQVGVNLSFLVPDLYGTVKAGFFPATSTVSGGTTVTFQGNSFGLGVNYTLVHSWDYLYGLLKWRGVSVGTGLTYTANTTTITTDIADMSESSQVALNSPYIADPTVTATAHSTQAKLSVTDSSVVIPIEVMTSVQALWLVNLGFGAGVDVAFSGTKIGIGGSSLVDLSGLQGAQYSQGTAVVNVSDSNGNGAVFVPRLAASLGVDLAIFKLDVPISYYPLNQALSVGLSAGIVW